MIYRFRVTYEEHEDVYRDIDIKANQNFSDFHSIIQQSISFDNSKPAFFYTSDDFWRKENEIPIGEIKDDKKNKKQEEPQKKKVIADYVDNPHQKFIYIFDPDKEWTFLIELIKILPAENSVVYPICRKSTGTAPKQYKEVLPPPVPEEEDDEPKKVKDSKDALMEDAAEKAVINEEGEGIPLGEEDVKTGEEEEDEKPSDEDEEGESSEGFEMDDED